MGGDVEEGEGKLVCKHWFLSLFCAVACYCACTERV